MTQSGFSHRMLFYADADEFLAGTVPYIRGALEGEEAAMVAVTPARARALRSELGADALDVSFVDMQQLGRNPARIIPFWREFVDRHGAAARPLRGIDEPTWAARSPAELDECQRHERLLNVAFADAPAWSLLCTYDSAALGHAVLRAGARCHPLLADGSGSRSNPGFAVAGAGAASVFAGTLSPRPHDAQTLAFDRDGLQRVRGQVAARAAQARLSPRRCSDLVSAASELAANSVRHGGGRGRVSIWRSEEELVVEVVDGGRIEEPLVGRRRPGPEETRGRGLWLANQLCDLVQIRSGTTGSTIRLRMGLG